MPGMHVSLYRRLRAKPENTLTANVRKRLKGLYRLHQIVVQMLSGRRGQQMEAEL